MAQRPAVFRIRTVRAARMKKCGAARNPKGGAARLPPARTKPLRRGEGPARQRLTSRSARAAAHPTIRNQATAVRAGTWPVWAPVKSAAVLRDFRARRRGFPSGSGMSCHCRRDREESALAHGIFCPKSPGRKAIYPKKHPTTCRGRLCFLFPFERVGL